MKRKYFQQPVVSLFGEKPIFWILDLRKLETELQQANRAFYNSFSLALPKAETLNTELGIPPQEPNTDFCPVSENSKPAPHLQLQCPHFEYE